MKWLCEMANLVIGDNEELLEHCHLIANPQMKAVWAHLHGNKLGQLAHGMPGQNTGTNTIAFIRRNQVPRNRTKDVTYGLITCLIQPEKKEDPNRMRLVARGDRVHYPGNVGTSTTGFLTVKLLINSTISTAGAKFMTMDIQDFYLNTPMARYKYMQLKLSDIPANVIKHDKLNEIATPDGYIYYKIQKGMDRLPQAGDNCPRTTCGPTETPWLLPGLWKHNSRPIVFSLVMNSFGVKYVGEENVQHLLDTIQKFTSFCAIGMGKNIAVSP
jgi:hypothetical protein